MVEEEIDLRSYIATLLPYGKWIAGTALVAAILGFVISSLLPSVYEASAVIIVAQPRYQIQFDPRFETAQGQSPAYKAFPTLAISDGVLQQVTEKYVPSPQAAIDDWRLEALSGMVAATSGGDPSLVLLTARSRSPDDAAAIANTWADVLVQVVNEIYDNSEKDVAFFERQVAQAARTLSEAEEALIDFEARNQTSIVTAQLDSYRQAQMDYLDGQRTIAYIIQDIEGLRGQWAEQSGSQSSSLADELTALLLQIKAFNAQTDAPLALQIDTRESFSGSSLAEQAALLDSLVVTLQAKSAEIDARLLELEPQILASQQELQKTSVEHEHLARAQELARETYLTLARKLDEARISAQEEHGTLQVGSYAALPERPVSPRRLFNTAVAGLLGLILGVLGAFAIQFWRRGDRESLAKEE